VGGRGGRSGCQWYEGGESKGAKKKLKILFSERNRGQLLGGLARDGRSISAKALASVEFFKRGITYHNVRKGRTQRR